MSLAILVVLTAVGTLGLMVTGDRGVFDALYLTVVILTTVGMDAPVTGAERAWALLLMIGGIGTVLYATGQMVSFVVEGHLKQLIGRRKVTERIGKLDGHFIIIGFGRMGQALCGTLTYRGRAFVLIESDPRRRREAEELGYLCVEGDAMHDTTLEEAGIARARGLVTCLSRDADNVLISLTARGLKHDLVITARCDEAGTEPKLHRAGADRVICPAVIGAARASDHLLNPQVDDMLELDGHWPDLELSRLSLSRFPGFTERTLEEACRVVGGKIVVVALIRRDGTRLIHPGSQTVVQPGDQIVVIGDTGCVNKLVTSLGVTRAA